MGRGEKVNCKRNLKKRVRDKDKDSDDSDEDYVVENEENVSDDDSEDCRVSLAQYASEESFDSFVEEEGEEEEEEEFRKPVRSKKKKGSFGKGKIEGKASRKRKRVSYEDDEEDDEEYVNDDEDEDDEEFTPDEEDNYCLDEVEELTAKRKKRNAKVVKRRVLKRGSGRGRKRRRKSRVTKKPLAKKGRNKRRLKKKERCEYEDDGDFLADSPVARETSKKISRVRKRKFSVNSDSDFVPDGSSDYEYTLSEEESEQVREASQLYGELKTSLRSSSVGKRIQENGDLCQQMQTKPVGRKGKEKVKEVKSELGNQVCGICLSEEDKRRLRGTLECCSHYFCFTCIMEWSKVESRCPLCKQRFSTITKNGRSAMGVDLRNMVIQVPKRDQVYQPTEEEIRSYIDPYENVICKECHEGGDDGLMLLCDLCDSSAHTYCVGLGRQVPEGNWYCDDCRPVALRSSGSQAQDPLPDQWNTSNNILSRQLPILNLEEGLDPNLESSPCLSIPQVFGSLSSPRFPTGDVQVASPVSGAGASTLSGRRHLHRHIRTLLSNMNPVANRIDAISAARLHSDFLSSQSDPVRETALQDLRTQEIGTSEQSLHKERLQANDRPSSSFQNRDSFFQTPNQLRRQTVRDPTITTADRSVNLTLWPEPMGINSVPGFDQFHQLRSRSSTEPDGTLSSYQVREESQFYDVKEQLQSMVKNHLGSLSRDIELDHDTLKDIARSSTHTILAACGLEHKRSEVHTVPLPSTCTHIDRVVAGQTSAMKGCCSSCFDSFVRDVVKRIMDTRPRQWLTLGL